VLNLPNLTTVYFHDNEFEGDIDDIVCDTDDSIYNFRQDISLQDVRADCIDEITCKCCTDCCDDVECCFTQDESGFSGCRKKDEI